MAHLRQRRIAATGGVDHIALASGDRMEAVEALGDGAVAGAVEPVLSDWLGRRSLIREIAPA